MEKEIDKSIELLKEFYRIFLNFIDDDDEINSKELVDFLNEKVIIIDKEDLYEILKVIYKISKNHHRNELFFTKIESILSILSDKIKQTFSNQEIFDIFKNNKQTLLVLFKTHLIVPNDSILNYILSKSDENEVNEEEDKKIKVTNSFHYDIYFYPEIKDLIDQKKKSSIEKKASYLNPNVFDDFENNRLKGENESFLCEIIRKDSVEKFVSYVSLKNISLKSTTIKPSVFETNSILIKNNPTLIEYAAFYGSIQIFQYLKYNKVELTPSLWKYGIHSKNAELIHLLEEYHVDPPNCSYEICLKNAISFHHNEIADYIINNLIENDDEIFEIESNFFNNISSYSFHYRNFYYWPTDLEDKFTFLYLCEFDYFKLVKLYLKFKKIDINFRVV